MMRSRPVDMGNWYLSELIILQLIYLTTDIDSHWTVRSTQSASLMVTQINEFQLKRANY